VIHNPWGTYQHFLPHATPKDIVQGDYGGWPGGLSKQDGANALSGAGSLDTATNHLHRTSRTKNLRIEFKSPGQTQRFLSAYGPIAQHFRPRRHLLSAPDYRHEMGQRFQMWGEITGTVMAA
jgi:hypothetical protein